MIEDWLQHERDVRSGKSGGTGGVDGSSGGRIDNHGGLPPGAAAVLQQKPLYKKFGPATMTAYSFLASSGFFGLTCAVFYHEPSDWSWAWASQTNTLIVLERALYLAHANARTLLVDTQAMFPNNSKITQKYNPGTRSLADILQIEPFRAACICIDDVSAATTRIREH